MGVFIQDKGDLIKFLREGEGGGDVDYVAYYTKADVEQKVDEDNWQLIENGEVAEEVAEPEEFKALDGGIYNSWDEVTDAIQVILNTTMAANDIETSVSLALDDTNVVLGAFNMVYVDTNTNAVTLTLDSSLTIGTMIDAKDISDNANVKNITISGAAQTIDGDASLVINGKSESFTVRKKSTTEWFIISGF